MSRSASSTTNKDGKLVERTATTMARRLIANLLRLPCTSKISVDDADHVAALLSGVLNNDRSFFRRDFDELSQFVLAERTALSKMVHDQRPPQAATHPTPERLYFMPQPGVSKARMQRLWPAQLLLLVATMSKAYRRGLADRLGISVEKLQAVADEGASLSVRRWTRPQFLQHLIEALSAYELNDPSLSFEVIGRELRDSIGGTVRLGFLEARFIKMLLKASGLPVTHGDFRAAGIEHVVKLKGEVMKKLRKAKMDLQIIPSTHAYAIR